MLYVVPRGFEPRQTESKSVVLPLYYGTKVCKSKGIPFIFKTSKDDFVKHFLILENVSKIRVLQQTNFF